MFYKSKLKKYLLNIQNTVNSDSFIELFYNSEVLGYVDTEFDKNMYAEFKLVLNEIYVKINENIDFSYLLLDNDSYIIPYTLGWIKIHVINDKPIGLTFYFKNKAYKFYLNDLNKKVNLNVLDIKEPRNLNIIKNNLGGLLWN